jgi:hypothetical protein
MLILFTLAPLNFFQGCINTLSKLLPNFISKFVDSFIKVASRNIDVYYTSRTNSQ